MQFAMLAGLGMHLLEDILAGVVLNHATQLAVNHAASGAPCEGELGTVEASPNATGARVEDASGPSATQASDRAPRASNAANDTVVKPVAKPDLSNLGPTAATLADKPQPSKTRSEDALTAVVHVHTHAGFDIPHVSRAGPGDVHFIIQALLMEFGVSTHSVLIGASSYFRALYCDMFSLWYRLLVFCWKRVFDALYISAFTGLAVGVLSDIDMTALFVALVFHQVLQRLVAMYPNVGVVFKCLIFACIIVVLRRNRSRLTTCRCGVSFSRIRNRTLLHLCHLRPYRHVYWYGPHLLRNAQHFRRNISVHPGQACFLLLSSF